MNNRNGDFTTRSKITIGMAWAAGALIVSGLGYHFTTILDMNKRFSVFEKYAARADERLKSMDESLQRLASGQDENEALIRSALQRTEAGTGRDALQDQRIEDNARRIDAIERKLDN